MNRESSESGCDTSCRCNVEKTSGIARRDFVKMLGIGAVAMGTGTWQTIAGPFSGDDFNQLIPDDKKLSRQWVASLFKRGEPTVYNLPNELKHIGMPIGGLCCGQIYLGGDGALWHWDIFQSEYTSDYAGGVGLGPHYAKPLMPESPLQQGFAIRVHQGLEPVILPLNHNGFKQITFQGQYPVGNVTYNDGRSPISAKLEAFSPFIPLDTERSSYPATIMNYKLKNHSSDTIKVDVIGWLQNAICPDHDLTVSATRRNRVIQNRQSLQLECSAIDQPSTTAGTKLSDLPGFGTMGLTLLGSDSNDMSTASVGNQVDAPSIFKTLDQAKQTKAQAVAELPFGQALVGAIGRTIEILPGRSENITFLVTWYFPDYKNPTGEFGTITDIKNLRRQYATRFKSSTEVSDEIVTHFKELSETTKLWVETWYDSTLPHWLLDRTFATVSNLATQTCHWFDNGRFWGWEGVNCCPGTCQHVWQYAQAIARLFPDLERTTREMVDYGIAYHESGALDYRAEAGKKVAHDGQAGTIIRAYREHQMSSDDAFLKKNWPRIKQSIIYLIYEDRDDNGIIEGKQYNTLDSAWFGPNAWISSLYLCALAAGEQMATEMNDEAFAQRCKTIRDAGSKNIVNDLFNGEYFIHHTDPNHPESINTNDGCHIDQVFGQSYAWQVNLDRILPKWETRSALKSLYRYNFTPDVGPYREKFKTIKGGRWYAMPGEGGMIMCTWPKGGSEKAAGQSKKAIWVGYFNECMTGFEYQVASHMIYEDLVRQGLTLTRMIHDRYHASKRNPWNEIECGDHYARAMAGFGVYLACLGYQYHGPKGELGFFPQFTGESFKAAFTAAQGWGSFQQWQSPGKQTATIVMRFGKLQLNQISVACEKFTPKNVIVTAESKTIESELVVDRQHVTVRFKSTVSLAAGQNLRVELGR